MEQYAEMPDRFELAKTFFDDLPLICMLIEKIEMLDLTKLRQLIRARYPNGLPQRQMRASSRSAKALQSSLRKAKAKIEDFVQSYEPGKPPKGNNRDIFVSSFIWNFGKKIGFDNDFSVNAALLGKVLAAAWRDLGLPLNDHRGHSREPLERWVLRSHTASHGIGRELEVVVRGTPVGGRDQGI